MGCTPNGHIPHITEWVPVIDQTSRISPTSDSCLYSDKPSSHGESKLAYAAAVSAQNLALHT